MEQEVITIEIELEPEPEIPPLPERLLKENKPKPGTVIHGTHREEDLIPAFYETLAKYAPRRAANLRYTYRDVIRAAYENRHHEDAPYVLEALYYALDEIAPPHHYFGAHPGDGSDFGFWRCEDA